MKIIKNELVVWFDVDETLILSTAPNASSAPIEMGLPYGGIQVVYAHNAHVDLVKRMQSRGFTVGVHSANGWAWAEQAVRKLNLQEHVDLVMTKAKTYVDDKEVQVWMSERVYLPA